MAGRKKHQTAGPIEYRRSKVLIRTRQSKEKFEYDKDEAEKMLIESLDVQHGGLSKAPPKRICYDCGKPVSPMRKLCGRCYFKRQENR